MVQIIVSVRGLVMNRLVEVLVPYHCWVVVWVVHHNSFKSMRSAGCHDDACVTPIFCRVGQVSWTSLGEWMLFRLFSLTGKMGNGMLTSMGGVTGGEGAVVEIFGPLLVS